MTDVSELLVVDGSRADNELLYDTLTAVRQFLEMPTAFLATFHGDQVVFRAASYAWPNADGALVQPSQAEATVCKLVRDGLLPQIVTDTSMAPRPATRSMLNIARIGSMISVPIHDASGQNTGLLCCVSPTPRALSSRDFNIASMFAKIAANIVYAQSETRPNRSSLRRRIKDVIKDMRVDIHLQPIVDLSTAKIRGFEALSRFHDDNPYKSPDKWFADARLVGMQPLLECTVIAEAIELLPFLPSETYLSINAAPDTVRLGAIADILQDSQPERIVLELTEHQKIDHLDQLILALHELRNMGVKIAIDDLGAGYASFSSILKLHPDIIKMDIALVKSINRDPASKALTSAIVKFAEDIEAVLIAEGIEHESERRTLIDLGVKLGQGFLLARPDLPDNLGLMPRP